MDNPISSKGQVVWLAMLVNRDWTAGPQRVCRQSIDIWVCIFSKLSANKRRWETKCECGSAGQLGDVDTLSVSVGQLTLMYTVISLIKRGPGESCQVAKCFLQQIKWCPSGYKWIFNNCGIDYVIGQPCKTNSVSVHVFADQGTIRRLLNIQTFECIDFTRNQCDCSASSDTSVGRSSFFIWRYKQCVLKLDSVIKFLLDFFTLTQVLINGI